MTPSEYDPAAVLCTVRVGAVATPATATDNACEVEAAEPSVSVAVDVTVHVAAHTATQTPVTADDGPAYGADATYLSMAPFSDAKPHAYPDLPGAWRVAVAPDPELPPEWPWRASLARAELGATWNRANLVLPSLAGDVKVHLKVTPPPGTKTLEVTLLRDGVEHEVRTLDGILRGGHELERALRWPRRQGEPGGRAAGILEHGRHLLLRRRVGIEQPHIDPGEHEPGRPAAADDAAAQQAHDPRPAAAGFTHLG